MSAGLELNPTQPLIAAVGAAPQPVEAITRFLQGPRHSVPLQSMRGVAALVVLLFHCSLYFDHGSAFSRLSAMILNGPAAVLSFYVLSGFVLGLSMIKRPLNAGEVGIFYLRRLFRIYPALWLAVAVAILYHLLAIRFGLSGSVSSWWRGYIHPFGLNSKLLVESFLGKATELPLPLWTLNIELLGSAMMPLIVFGMVRTRWLLAIILGLLFALDRVFHVQAALPLTGFVYGAGAVLCIGWLGARVRSQAASWRLASLGLAMLWFGRNCFGLIADQPYGIVGVTVSSLGAALLIVILYARAADFAFLSGPLFVWLGDVSYSLYLLHMPILGLTALMLGSIAGGLSPLAMTLILVPLTVVLTGIAATASYRYVEVPGILAGKTLLARVA